MRPINCGFGCLKGSLFFLEVVLSIVNPVNKLYFLAYKVQQTFFVPMKKKTWISEQHDTSCLLSKYYSYWNIFHLVKMRNLSLVLIWSLLSLRSLRKKSSAIATIIAIKRRPLSFIPQLLVSSVKESLIQIMCIAIYRFGSHDVLLPSICSQYYGHNS